MGASLIGASEPVLARGGLRTTPRMLRIAARRIVFTMLVAASFAYLVGALLALIRVNGVSPLECVIFVLSVLLLLPIVVSFWIAVIGFVVEDRDAMRLDLAHEAARGNSPLTPTAVAVPVYNEDIERVLARIRATHESLAAIESSSAFDFFVLSDTMDARRWLDEELAIARFRARFPEPERIHYRNRPRNVGKKAGNIADFCRAHGERYAFMIVFDADSVMSGESLVKLVRAMERHPRIGIIQAPPTPVNRRSLFGRLQQFSARAYGPTWAAGLAYLQCGEGNYYGHNAILRIEPFLEHCRLPVLPGKAPLGGSVLSHDFVEAALMRRAGYEVHLAAGLDGSFEEPPPTLIEFTARDRRWCQGNMQHARLLGMRGLHPISRVHLFLGVMSYASSPLWLLLLLITTAEALRERWSQHQYFAPGGSLFPVFEASIETQAKILFACVLALLFLPRVLALVARLSDRDERRRFGGAARFVASGVFESLVSMLLAPILALAQTQFVISILMGKSTGWNAPTRRDRGTTFAEALRRHGGATILGLAWGAFLWHESTALFWWMLPVLSGMALAIPLSMASSQVGAGEWARRHGLLLTPEETSPQPVLSFLRDELARLSTDERARKPTASATQREASALERVLTDPEARAAHFTFTPAPEIDDPLLEHELEGLVLKCRLHGAAALNDEEQRRLLLAPRALTALIESPS
jgi:membrane glycosyltransferase